jgi:hypothetical protein
MVAGNKNVYETIIEHLFHERYKSGDSKVFFERDDLIGAAEELGVLLPKNLGDVIYSFRYRNPLPASVRETAPDGKAWQIVGEGQARYAFRLLPDAPLAPSPHLQAIKIPNATPTLISSYAFSSEQALLAKVRYNRLIDLFTGIVCFSLQNHFKTTVSGIGQVETDEIYLGVDKQGVQYVLPVEAKGGADHLSVVQLMQDLALSKEKFPLLKCLVIGAQFVDDDVSLMLFEEDPENLGSVHMIGERRYRLVPIDDISRSDLDSYQASVDS